MIPTKNTFRLIEELFSFSYFLILISVFFFSCADKTSEVFPDIGVDNDAKEKTIYELNLRIHLMRDITMNHSTGVSMDSWVSVSDVSDSIIVELNDIWQQADIHWLIESIIEEDVVKGDTYEESIAFIASTKRDSEGHSDPDRLPHLFSLMQPQYMSTADEIGENLFHIYLFPFIGNTSQGNAMSGFNFHSVVGTWTNKHNGGEIPEKTLLTENQNSFNRGSLSRTIAHELGHVLNLHHNECNSNCLMGGGSSGYLLSDGQIAAARFAALERILF